MQCSANLISENLPVGWKAVVQGSCGKVCYTASDGTKLSSHAQAVRYLADKKIDKEDRDEILSSLQWNEEGLSPELFARKHDIHGQLKQKTRNGLRSRRALSPQVALDRLGTSCLLAPLACFAGVQSHGAIAMSHERTRRVMYLAARCRAILIMVVGLPPA